jgi:hypothetical protein
VYSVQLCEDLDTSNLPPPTSPHKPAHDETKENDLGPLPVPTPVELPKFKNFSTSGYFTDPFRNQSRCIRLKDCTPARPSHQQEPFVATPKAKPEVIRPPSFDITPSASRSETLTPPQDAMVLVSSPAEPLQAPPPESTSEASEHPPPDHSFTILCHKVADQTSQLRQAMEGFRLHAFDATIPKDYMLFIFTLLTEAQNALGEYPHSLWLQQADIIRNWALCINQLWDIVQPRVYDLVRQHGLAMEMFLAKLLDSGRFYGLTLLDPDMIPLPPSPPAQTQQLLPPQSQQPLLFQPTLQPSPSQPIQQPPTPALSQQQLVHNIQPIFSTPSIALQNAINAPTSTSPRSAILRTINFNVQPPAPAAPIQFQQVQHPDFIPQTQKLIWPPPAQQPLPPALVQPPSFAPIQPPAPVYNTSTKASTSMQATTKPASSTSLASSSSAPKPAAPGLPKFDIQPTASDDSDDGLADAINKGFEETDSNPIISAPDAAASQQAANPFEPKPSSSRPVRKIRARRPQSAFTSSFVATSSTAPALPVASSDQAFSSSAGPPRKDVSMIKLSISIRRISEWVSLSHEELSALKKENWDWSDDTSLWRYDGKADLSPNDNATACKNAKHVAAELNSISTRFIRACVILRCQAQAGDWRNRVTNDPELLQTIEQTLRTARKMYEISGPETKLSAWSDAVLFFDQNIIDDERVVAGLIKHYRKDAWEPVAALWRAIDFYWLKA